MNTANFSGNLTKDVRVTQSQSGMAMAFFTIAVNSGFGDRKHVDFVDCSLFGKRAEGGLIQYLVKGQQVLASGTITLEAREYEGKTYHSMKLNVNDVDLVGNKPESQAPAVSNQPTKQADSFDEEEPPF